MVEADSVLDSRYSDEERNSSLEDDDYSDQSVLQLNFKMVDQDLQRPQTKLPGIQPNILIKKPSDVSDNSMLGDETPPMKLRSKNRQQRFASETMVIEEKNKEDDGEKLEFLPKVMQTSAAEQARINANIMSFDQRLNEFEQMFNHINDELDFNKLNKLNLLERNRGTEYISQMYLGDEPRIKEADSDEESDIV